MYDGTLLERDELLADLQRFLSVARSGSGSLVLVSGEAGSGKTSLMRELESRVAGDVLVMVGGCDPLSTPRPLSPLVDIAGDRESGLGGVMDEGTSALDTFALVLERLRTSIRPILMIIEDVHWADQATLDLLRYLGRRIEKSKAVVLCTYRDDEVGSEHPLRPVLGQLASLPTTRRMAVPSLTEAGVRALVGDRAIDADRLHSVTGGNPFFVTEVIAAGGELSSTVQDAVLARVSGLDQASRRVVEVVAIAPRSLEVERVEALVDAPVADIDRAVGSGVLIADGASLRFRHDLAREAVEASLPPGRRIELHRRMLDSLAADVTSDVARLAHHAVRAEAGDLIVEYAPAAARDAAQRGSRKEAIALYLAALDHADLLDGDTVAEIRLALCTQLGPVDRHHEALDHAKEAARHFRSSGQTERLAMATVEVARYRHRLNDREGCRRALDDAVAMLRPHGASRALASALARSALFDMLARQRDDAYRAASQSQAMAEAVQSSDVAWTAEMTLGTIEMVLGDPLAGSSMLRHSYEQAVERGDISGIVTALSMLGSGGGEARIYDVALEALDEGIRRGLASDDDYTVAYNRAWGARIAFEQGRWDDAVALAELVDRTSGDRIGISLATANGALGRVRVRRGDPGGRDLLGGIAATQQNHEIQHVWSPVCGLAEYHWLAGKPDEMVAVLADAWDRAMATDSEWARGEVGFWMWKAGAIDGPPEGAAQPFALQMAGDWRGAADEWRRIGCPYEVALALADGDREAVLQAVAIFDSLGARPAGLLARGRLRDMGVEAIPRGPTAETKSNPAGLTPRQLEVLGLIGAGLPNGDIADRLFISKKTVEHHVAAVYTKLGVSSRSEAMAEAMRLGLGSKSD